jgi:hypothetical protein
MKAKIAVATVSGRDYYKLVKELKRKQLSFRSLKPWDSIPLDIKVVITTKEESQQVTHPQVIIFEQGTNPESVVDRALLVVQGKRSYEKVVVGVDPGKTYGIALLGDDKVLETLTSPSIEMAINLILDWVNRFPATTKEVHVGNGPKKYTKRLIQLLNEKLPEETMIKIVSEAGTSHTVGEYINRRGLRDTVSATEIALRKGKIFARKDMK